MLMLLLLLLLRRRRQRRAADEEEEEQDKPRGAAGDVGKEKSGTSEIPGADTAGAAFSWLDLRPCKLNRPVPAGLRTS